MTDYSNYWIEKFGDLRDVSIAKIEKSEEHSGWEAIFKDQKEGDYYVVEIRQMCKMPIEEIHVEIKKTSAEIDRVVEDIEGFCHTVNEMLAKDNPCKPYNRVKGWL